MLSEDLINDIIPPRCPYCGQKMEEHHSKMWAGMNSVYLAIEFRCSGSQELPHSFKLRAKTEEEWERHEEVIGRLM
jgi:hypothetical protein